jgi:hypothetical protein
MVFKDHQLPSLYFYRSCEGKNPSLLRGIFCVLLLIFLVSLEFNPKKYSFIRSHEMFLLISLFQKKE